MEILDVFPEILASFALFPCGLFMGYMMYVYPMGTNFQRISKYEKLWPFIIGGAAALTTASFFVTIKFIYKRYKFEHFYFIIVGLLSLGSSAVINYFLYNSTGNTQLNMGFAGHGICYVSAMSYQNVRTKNSKYRFLKLSAPHALYLLGISTGTTVTWKLAQQEDAELMFIRETLGLILAITCSILIIAFLINELIQAAEVKSYNYKKSLCSTLNCDNIFQINSTLGGISESNYLTIILMVIYGVASKIFTIMFFYHPLYIFYEMFSTNSDMPNYVLLQWFGLLGFFISIVVLAILNYKLVFLFSVALKIVSLGAILIFYKNMQILFLVVFMILGFGFSCPDTNIMSFSSLRINELTLAIGYCCEHFLIGLSQYHVLSNHDAIAGPNEYYKSILPHVLTFIVILSGIGLMGMMLITNGKTLQVPDQVECVNKLVVNQFNEKLYIINNFLTNKPILQLQ